MQQKKVKFEINEEELNKYFTYLEKCDHINKKIKEFDFFEYEEFLDKKIDQIDYSNLREDEPIDITESQRELLFKNVAKFEDGYIVIKNEK